MKSRTIVSVTPSRLALWRSAIAIAQADGNITNSERDILHDFMANHDFSNEQLDIIDNDFAKGVKLDDVFDDVTDQRDRAHLINFARVLVHIDGDFNDAEKILLDHMNKVHAEAINLHKVLSDSRAEARSIIGKYREEKLKLQREERAKSSVLSRPFAYLVDEFSNQTDGF